MNESGLPKRFQDAIALLTRALLNKTLRHQHRLAFRRRRIGLLHTQRIALCAGRLVP
jgi:hypothetical protein